MEALLGAEVVNGQGAAVPVASFSGVGKLVGLYFSAHWCPPCRGFTPVLAEFYKKVKAGAKGNSLEIVFVSFDREENTFNEYFATQPWLSVAWDKGELRNELGEKMDVKGIPSFIILDGQTGEVKESNGRGKVTSDPQGQNFPWGM